MLTLLLSLAPAAHATVPDVFGSGPANIGIAGAAVSRADDPFAAFYNPAGLGQIAYPTLSMGGIRGQANLMGFEGVVYDTNGDGSLVDEFGAPDYGDVGVDYRVWDPEDPNTWYTDGTQVGAAFPLLDAWLRDQHNAVLKNLRVTMGVAVHLPTQTTLRMQMQDPYMPYYVMFRNRNDRFALHPALGVKVFRGLYLGAGAQMMFDISAKIRLSSYTTAESFPNDEGEDELRVVVDSQIENMELNLAPTMSPTFGLLFRPGELLKLDTSTAAGNLLSHSSFGFSYRAPWFSKTSADVAVLANGEVSFDDETLLLSTLVAEPVTIELRDLISLYNPPVVSLGFTTGWSFGSTDSVDVSLDLVRTEWSKFAETTSPYSEMEVEALTGASITIITGTDYGDPAFADTLSIRTGLSWGRCWRRCDGADLNPGLGVGTVVRAGYAFVPSPVPDQTRYTNYMDSDRNVFTGGLGVELLNRGVGPVVLDVGGQYHSMATRTVTKDADLWTDTDGDGAPNYTRGAPLAGELTSGGNLWVVSMGAEFTFGANPQARERRGRTAQELPNAGIVPVRTGGGPLIDPVQDRTLEPAKEPAAEPSSSDSAAQEAPGTEAPADTTPPSDSP